MPRQKPFKDIGLGVSRGLALRPRADESDRSRDEADVAVSFRSSPEDAERVATRARELGLSRAALTRGLVQAALDALDRGLLRFDVEIVATLRVDKLGRRRPAERQVARPAWTVGETSSSSELVQGSDRTSHNDSITMRGLFGGLSKIYPHGGAEVGRPGDDVPEGKARPRG